MKVIITGASGMIGKGVMLECLDHPKITEALVIVRRPMDEKHAKLKQLIHADFADFSTAESELKGYDACFHCMGVSAAGMNEAQYTNMTYNFSMALGKTLHAIAPEMTFLYVSGMGTDSTEKGRQMWARVKGKTENDLLKLGFRQAYMFRPGAIIPKRGVAPKAKATRIALNLLGWILPLIKVLSPNSVTDTTKIGLSMIHVAMNGFDSSLLFPKDINKTGS